ncbi:hypothetical protein BO443_100166 [Burkholderia orbicola]
MSGECTTSFFYTAKHSFSVQDSLSARSCAALKMMTRMTLHVPRCRPMHAPGRITRSLDALRPDRRRRRRYANDARHARTHAAIDVRYGRDA